jgi:4-diphosphocytidyl-2-C-methyl-D-erythritol kinase
MKIKANAKINFGLKICGKRPDGYHLIDTVMHSVNLYDLIEIEKAEEIAVICSNSDINEKENIAYKAAELFFLKTGISSGAKIKIQKNIPTCAGMGGGSADAAAVLVGLNNLYGANLSEQTLCEMALKLGADVPFFIKGGCQRAEGIGEILTPFEPLEKGYIVLAKADKKPSTAEMYRIIDNNEQVDVNIEKILNCIKENDLSGLSKNLCNAFETAWGNSALKERMSAFSPLTVSLTGSGPTWYALYEDFESANKLFASLKEENIEAYLVTPTETALEIE